MPKLQPEAVTNIADPAIRIRMMRETVVLLQERPDLGFVLMSLVAAFIDGLAKGKPATHGRRISSTSKTISQRCAQSLARKRSTHISGHAPFTSSRHGHLSQLVMAARENTCHTVKLRGGSGRS